MAANTVNFGWDDIVVAFVIFSAIAVGILIFFSPLIAAYLILPYPANVLIIGIYASGFFVVIRMALRDYLDKGQEEIDVRLNING